MTSSTLLAGVRARDPAAWQRFMLLYRPLVLYWCQQKGLQAGDAEDVAQEVFKAVDRAIGQFRHDQPGHTLRGWLRTITEHERVNHIRREARQPAGVGGSSAQQEIQDIPAPPPDSDSASESDPEETWILIRQALELVLARFKAQTREAFWRVVAERQKPEDVAEALGVRVHVVYLAKSRVLKRLQEEFGDLVDLERVLNPDPNPCP